jgi:hypothetical protein
MSWTVEKRVMHRPSDLGSYPNLLEAKLCQDWKKVSNLGYCYYCAYGVWEGSSFQDFAWLPQKENIFIVWSWLGTHVNHTPLSSTPSRPSSVSLSFSLFLIRKKPSRIWCFLPSLGRGACSGLITSSSAGFPMEQSVMGLGVQWLREAWQI